MDIIFRPDASSADWNGMLGEGLVDAVLTLSRPYQSNTVNVEQLRHEPIIVAVNPSHRLARLDNVQPDEFRTETLIHTEAGCNYRAIFERLLRNHSVTPANVLEFHSLEAIKQCALTGMGVAVLPQVVIQPELAAGRLVGLQVAELEFNISTQLIWHKDKWLSPALGAFLVMTRAIVGGVNVSKSVVSEAVVSEPGGQ
ncbi:MAG: substrate-binding domain-containing protein [Caldilineaceae bacterium]